MRKLLILLILLISTKASAQTPIIIGPQTQLQWDMFAFVPATSSTCIYAVSQGTGPFNNITAPVTCIALGTTDSTCSVNLIASGLPIGSNSIRMTATCSGITTLPSTSFAYVDMVIPIPSNLRIR